MILRLSFAAAAIAIAAGTPAFASPVNATAFEASVTYDDLDLATGEGAARLDERVRIKVRQMCRNGGRDGASLRLERECQVSALAAAAPAIRVAVVNARLERVRLAANTPASPAATPGA
ncbi:UrcA family protein [Porphyrobacter sp. AAP60]|uniref:UrcA family protein n=1 Tax=Porphyrobacter sp. AAP60 TaxID=1523423 RepID=UPI0006B8B686|nr:UrcA family protein [Porphyrobacter sp. AAP60]KPF65154.1 hypothetical protein IP79_02960 [Porphyrobacter sp. AAP60]